MTGTSPTEAASTSSNTTNQGAKSLDLDAANGMASLQASTQAFESFSTHQKHEEVDSVAVGAVAHVIRRAFHPFYKDPEALNLKVNASMESEPGHDLLEGREEAASKDDESKQVVDESPFVALAQARKDAIAQELANKDEQAKSLLHLIETRRQEAADIDARIAQEVSAQGLDIKTHLPVGPTHLRLNEHEVQMAQEHGVDCGELAPALLHAKTFMVEYEQRRKKSGGSGKQMPWQPDANKQEMAGYLHTTRASTIRTDAIRTHHQHDITEVKRAHAVQRTASAATNSLERLDRVKKQPQTMKIVEKEANHAILTRMETKLAFQRNPRYTRRDGSKIGTTRTANRLSESVSSGTTCFAIAPKPPIRFTSYDGGESYEQTVYVRNTSALSRSARILPPGTMHFSLISVTFPMDRNLVAPGMHIEIRLRFTPDSRADYHDTLTVQYETKQGAAGSGTLVVPLVASRERPKLTLPLVVQAQHTLVGGRSVTFIQCKNLGGNTQCWLLTESAYSHFNDPNNLNSQAHLAVQNLERESTLESSLDIGPFSLTPSAFTLEKGQSIDLELVYTPYAIGDQQERFVLIYNNCLVQVFQVVGRGCEVDIAATQVNQKPIALKPLEKDRLDRLYFSDKVVVNASARQTLVMTNATPVVVNYSWQLQLIDNDEKNEGSGSSLASKWTPSFCITPASGIFASSSSKEFTLEFAPTEARPYACQATLMINGIPACSMPGPHQSEQLKALLHTATQTKPALVELQDAIPAFSIQLYGCGTPGSFTITPTLIASWKPTESDAIQGSEPPPVHVLHLKKQYASSVVVTNDCDARVAFCWDLARTRQRPVATNGSSLPPLVPSDQAPSFDLILSPLEGELESFGQQRIDVAFTPFCTGSFSLSVPCRLVSSTDDSNLKTPQYERWLLLEGRIAKAEVEIVTREVDFGLVVVGASAESLMAIRNPSQSRPTPWKVIHVTGSISDIESEVTLPAQSPLSPKLRRSNSRDSILSRRSATSSNSGNETARTLFTLKDAQPRATITFAPEAGILAPGESCIVTATCAAGALPERFRGHFRCQTALERTFNGFQSTQATVSSRAEIQCPDVFLSTRHLAIGTSYLGVERHQTFELINASNLETAFKFVEPEGASQASTVTFAPTQGLLHSKERLVVTLSYTPRQLGQYTTLLACSVRGLPGPLGFEVTSHHKGLVLSYKLVQTPLHSDNGVAASSSAFELPKAPKEIALERGISLAQCALEPDINPSSNVPQLAFGDSVPLGETRVITLLIQNYSGIDALVAFEASKYPAAVVEKHQLASTFTTSAHKPMTRLSDAQDYEHRYQSETGRAYCRQRAEQDQLRQLLRFNRGVAFIVSPAHVSVPPWDQALVQVSCVSNMPGPYVDTIVSRATGALPVILDTHVNIIGSPLTLERNCVGLYFNKSKTSENSPTLHFGAVCVRSKPVTKVLKVMNRGPQRAHVKWKVVESGCEEQVVSVTLRVDFGSKIRLCITPCDHDSPSESPFTVEPQLEWISAFSTMPFRVTFHSQTNKVGATRLVLLADAHWYESHVEDNRHVDSGTKSSVTLASVNSSVDPRYEDDLKTRTKQKNKSRTLAVGKAFAAVRASTLDRKPQPRIGKTRASSYSPKCLRVLLSADTIEPELYIDKPRELLQPSLIASTSASIANSLLPSPQLLAPYHIKFTTWSTLLSPTKPPHPFHCREVVLQNRMGTNLTFRVECNGPFAVANADSLAPRHPLSTSHLPAAHRRSSAQSESCLFQLPPQLSVRLELQFQPPASLTSTSLPSKVLQPQTEALHSQVDGDLRILFSTSSIQTIRLTAVVLYPALLVSPSVYTFKRCHVTAIQSIILRLANPTIVPAYFAIHHVPKPKPLSRAQQEETRRYHAHLTDEPEVFIFSQLAGEVRGPTTSLESAEGYLRGTDSMAERVHHDTSTTPPLVSAPFEIRVDFRPRQSDRQYQSRYRFQLQHGRDFEILLQGTSHLDEDDEAT